MTEEEFKSNWLAITEPNQKTFNLEITENDLTESEIIRLFELNNFTYFATKLNPQMQSFLRRITVFWGQNDFE